MDPLTVGLTAASILGNLYTNQQARAEARENRRFQERMSSTAAQRSAADYRAAGLNPALAYDRTASSPSGAVASINDPIGPGISNAMQAMRMRQEFKWQERINEETVRKIANEADLAGAQNARTVQENQFAKELQPHIVALQKANALMTALGIPAAQNEAELAKRLGLLGPALGMTLNTARGVAGIISGIRRAPAKVIKNVTFNPRPK